MIPGDWIKIVVPGGDVSGSGATGTATAARWRDGRIDGRRTFDFGEESTENSNRKREAVIEAAEQIFVGELELVQINLSAAGDVAGREIEGL